MKSCFYKTLSAVELRKVLYRIMIFVATQWPLRGTATHLICKNSVDADALPVPFLSKYSYQTEGMKQSKRIHCYQETGKRHAAENSRRLLFSAKLFKKVMEKLARLNFPVCHFVPLVVGLSVF